MYVCGSVYLYMVPYVCVYACVVSVCMTDVFHISTQKHLFFGSNQSMSMTNLVSGCSL